MLRDGLPGGGHLSNSCIPSITRLMAAGTSRVTGSPLLRNNHHNRSHPVAVPEADDRAASVLSHPLCWLRPAAAPSGKESPVGSAQSTEGTPHFSLNTAQINIH